LPRGIDAVAGEIERQTPFSPDQVYLGYHVDAEVDTRGRVLAHLSLVPCARADEMLRTLADHGVTPDRITLGDEANENSLGDTVHIITSRRAAPAPRFWLAAAGVLFLLALASPFWRNHSALTQIENELGRAQQAALQLGGRQDGADDARSQIVWLGKWRGQRPVLTSLLNAISVALPDTAYLAQFELTGHVLSLQGVARAAPELIAALEALPEVAKVEFSAPTLRDPATGLEQFQLTLDLRAAQTPDSKP
jgi:general secretion pathway protein L